MKKILSAAIQLNTGADKHLNIDRATKLIQKAYRRGARLIVLPETFNWRGSRKDIPEKAEPIPGPTAEHMAALAGSLRIFLVCGSILETNPVNPQKPYNTSMLLDPCGNITACYRKIHLFRLTREDKTTIDESRIYSAGNAVTTASTPWGTVGFSICFDLRFPELYRSLVRQGAEIIFVPSAFTSHTGKAHWETLIRARAIENQVYIIAPNQEGTDPLGNSCYGHSTIVDPWGSVVARCQKGEQIIYAELDLRYLKKVRKDLPLLDHLENKHNSYLLS